MKRNLMSFAAIAAMCLSGGCAYTALVAMPSGNKVVVAKSVLGGMGRGLYVCTVTPEGLSDCKEKETP